MEHPTNGLLTVPSDAKVSMDVATWNVLHDGRIAATKGDVPGNLILTIEIAYLRRHLPSRCRDLSLTLLGCERFEYQPHEEPALTEPSAIAALRLEFALNQMGTVLPWSVRTAPTEGSYSCGMKMRLSQPPKVERFPKMTWRQQRSGTGPWGTEGLTAARHGPFGSPSSARKIASS